MPTPMVDRDYYSEILREMMCCMSVFVNYEPWFI